MKTLLEAMHNLKENINKELVKKDLDEITNLLGLQSDLDLSKLPFRNSIKTFSKTETREKDFNIKSSINIINKLIGSFEDYYILSCFVIGNPISIPINIYYSENNKIEDINFGLEIIDKGRISTTSEKILKATLSNSIWKDKVKFYLTGENNKTISDLGYTLYINIIPSNIDIVKDILNSYQSKLDSIGEKAYNKKSLPLNQIKEIKKEVDNWVSNLGIEDTEDMIFNENPESNDGIFSDDRLFEIVPEAGEDTEIDDMIITTIKNYFNMKYKIK